MHNAEPTLLEVALPPFVPREDARLLLGVKLFETGHLSLGQAARMAAMSKRGFVEAASRQGVAVVNYPASELAGETAW